MNPAALGIGETELIAGVKNFIEEVKGTGLPYISTNLQDKDQKNPFPRSMVVELPYKGSKIRIAFLSVLSPKLANRIPQLSKEGYQIADPIVALKDELSRLHEAPNPPQTAILLTTSDAALLERIRLQASGISIMLGDPSLATLRIEEARVTFQPFYHLSKGAPLTLPMDGLGQLTLDFNGEFIDTIKSKQISLDDYAPANKKFRARLNQNRAKVYQELDSVLLRPSGQGTQARYTQESWNTLICEALRHSTQADSVLIHDLLAPPDFAGSITELQLTERIRNVEQLERYWILGSNLSKVLTQSKDSIQVACGASPSSPKVDGRPIEGNRYYSVVTTEHSRNLANLTALLKGGHSQKLLDKREMELIKNEDGSPAHLKKAVLSSLRSIRDEYGLAKLNQTLLIDLPREKRPLWLFRVRKIGLHTESFGGTENEAFASVPDTMANASSSATQGGSLDLAFD